MPDPTKSTAQQQADLAAAGDLLLAGRRLGLDTPDICTAMLLAIKRMGAVMDDGDRWALARQVYATADHLAALAPASGEPS